MLLISIQQIWLKLKIYKIYIVFEIIFMGQIFAANCNGIYDLFYFLDQSRKHGRLAEIGFVLCYKNKHMQEK